MNRRKSLLQRIGETLANDDSRNKLKKRLWFGVRLCSAGFALLYCVALIAILLGFRWVGENNLSIAFALYVPRTVFVLPAFAIIPWLLLVHWRFALLTLLVVGVFLGFGMGYQWRPPSGLGPSSPPDTLTMVSYNRGEHMNQSLQPFLEKTEPDIIAMQVARKRSKRYANAPGYEEYEHVEGVWEFTLLSKYPIVSAEAVPTSYDRNERSVPAARFEIDVEGRRVAIYNVHVRSPRDTLQYYMRGAFLYGMIGLPGTPWGEKRKKNQIFWDERIAQAREILDKIEKDPLPVIVAGDLNAPSEGYIHGLFAEALRDSHLEAGSGFGFTFPGVTRNPLSGGGPWMRIDYLFSDKENWKPLWSITESERPSQHRAIAAQFRLKPQK